MTHHILPNFAKIVDRVGGRGDPCKTPRASKTPHGLFSETIDHFSFFNIPRYQTNKEGSSDAMGWLFLFVGPCYPLKRVFGGFLK